MEQYKAIHKYIVVTTNNEYIEVEMEQTPSVGETVIGRNELDILTVGIVREITDEISVLVECALSPESRLMAMF